MMFCRTGTFTKNLNAEFFLSLLFAVAQVAFVLVVAGCAGSAPDKNASNLELQNVSVSAEQSSFSNKHFLWKISDDNSSAWVLGSVHFGDSSFYPFDPVIENAFADAEELVVEIDMSNDSVNNEVAEQSMRNGLNKPGVRLQDILPAELWASLDSICVAWGIPSANFQMFRPWFAATSISAFAIQRAGIDANLGIDMVLLDRAATEGKAVVGLETAQEQIGALAGAGESNDSESSDSASADSDSAGIYYLKTTLREISELDSMVSQIVVAWKTGNDSLLRVALGEDDEDEEDETPAEKGYKEEFEQRVYTNRNEKMAEAIANFVKEDRNVFVVVGVAHLALEKGNVIEMLKKKGLKVERF